MQMKKRTIITSVIVLVLLVLANIFNTVSKELPVDSMLKTLFSMARHFIHTSLIVAWIVSIRERIIQKPVRSLLIGVGLLILFWITVRVLKWDFIVFDTTFTRYCWYAYYIPIIFIPLFAVFIIDYIGKPENYVASPWMKLLYIPALALVFAVFTNDYHQMVFEFPNGIKYFNTDYSYGVLYFIIMAWVVVLAIYSIVRLMLKCRVPGSRAFRWMPVMVFEGAVVFWVLYGMGMVRCDMTAVNCLIIILLLESSIQSGLIRSNTHYSSLFSASTIKSKVADHDYNICYASKNSKSFDKAILMQAKQGPVTVDNYRLNSAEITGGYVFWLDDISKITQITQKLQSIGKRLSEKTVWFELSWSLRKRKRELKNKLVFMTVLPMR